MIAVDSNILVYAFATEMPQHAAAKAAIRALAQSPAAWAIPWPCIHEFFAIATNPKLFTAEGLGESALAQIREWMRSPSLELLTESPKHWQTLKRLLLDANAVGPMVHDAKIAAICLDRGVSELLSHDRDFERFAQLRLRKLTD